MKTQLFSTGLIIMLFGMILFMACRHEQMQQFTVSLVNIDGTKETYAMYAGSMLLVNEGDMHVVAKAVRGNETELELEVTRFTVTHDSIKGGYTIQKADANTNKISKAKNGLLNPAGGVQVQLESMAMIDTGRRPRGACQGVCCEAKCFTLYCCSDPDECKNAPCNCQPPSNCPKPQPDAPASHFFELYLSGKDVMVFKD